MLFGVDISIEADNSWAVISKRAIAYSGLIDLNGLLNYEIQELNFSLKNLSQLIEGRTFFLSNTVLSTQRYEENNFSDIGFGVFGIGPGDLQAGDILVMLAGCEQSLFFRRTEMGHRVLGDGAMTVLPEHFEASFWSGVEETHHEVRIALE